VDPRLPKMLLVLLIVTALIYFSYLYPQLPERMPSHFNSSGAPNAWMPKSSFFTFFPGVIFLVCLISLGVPKLISRLPPDQINLPNKGYWLAPDRRADTFQFFEASFAWFGCAMLAFFVFGIYLAAQASLAPASGFDTNTFLLGLAALFVFLLFWLFRLFFHFSRPRSNPVR
jgi:uncharacterized membrane protein